MSRIRSAVLAIVAATGLFAATAALAQPVDVSPWVTNGTIYAMARFENTVYLGGSFTEIAPATGGGVPIDPATGAPIPGFPWVVGQVFSVTGDLQGGWYIGGLFTSVGGQPRQNLARVAPDMSVTAWNPGADGVVLSLRPSLTGTVYVGGDFHSIGGAARQFLAEVGSNGLATAWNPNPNSAVLALNQVGSHVYAGGQFTFIGTTPRSHFAQIDATTGLATTWNVAVNGDVNTIELAARGASWVLLIGGAFSTAGGQPRNNIAEISPAGAVTAWNPNANGTVHDIEDRASVYVAGAFTTIGGQPRNRIAALHASTALATGWNPNADGVVRSIQWSNFHVFAGGDFMTIGGQPRHHLAKLEEGAGSAAAWNPGPNHVVRSVVIGNNGLYAGGDFTAMAGLTRSNLAAFDLDARAFTSFNPGIDGTVLALAPLAYGPTLYSLYVGGSFMNVGGQPRNRIAEIRPWNGMPTAWNPDANGVVRSIVLRGSSAPTLFAAGSFTNIGASSRNRVAELELSTGQATPWSATFDGDVHALALGNSSVYVGGFFTTINGLPRSRIGALALSGGTGAWNPNASGTVRSLLVRGTTVYAGGDFATIGGQARSRIAALDAAGAATAWNPGANGIVRSLALGGAGLFAGGDFTVVGGQARQRIANLDLATGAVDPWEAPVADHEVYALLYHGTRLYAGGSFRGVGSAPQANFAVIGQAPIVSCLPTALTSPAGLRPRAIVTGDFDRDGVRDLVVCNDNMFVPEATVLLGSNGPDGAGDGTFSIAQSLPLVARPMHAVVADFDADGFEDLVISQSAETGLIWLYRNIGGTFGPPTEFPLYGRSDGLAAADLDQDGILDLAVCLTDSASTPGKGGILILKGDGTGGVWNGGFTVGPRLPASSQFAQRVLAQDMDNDGILDLLYGPSVVGFVHLLPGLQVGCGTLTGIPAAGERGVGMVPGDFDEDGRVDIAVLGSRTIRVRRNVPLDLETCTFNTAPMDTLELPSAGRDLAVLDYDLDGILDLACTLDSVDAVLLFPGQGTAGVGNGQFGAPVTLGTMDAWGIAVGDFVANGSPDLVVGQRDCGTVTVIDQASSPLLATNLDLVAPNGGEIWPQAGLPPLPPASAGLLELDSAAPFASTVAAFPEDPAWIASAQQIQWTKGDGVQAVDVEVSRNDGATWQPIATNVPGTAMTWIVTPPVTASARVRVRDSAVPSRADASDASFQIPSSTIGVEPGPATALAFRLQDRHPAVGPMRFRLETPSSADVRIEVFDLAGRLVRVLAKSVFTAGGHDLTWDTRDERGKACARGVYFVRARIGTFGVTRKVVLAG